MGSFRILNDTKPCIFCLNRDLTLLSANTTQGLLQETWNIVLISFNCCRYKEKKCRDKRDVPTVATVIQDTTLVVQHVRGQEKVCMEMQVEISRLWRSTV
jgi:hypothetical protein